MYFVYIYVMVICGKLRFVVVVIIASRLVRCTIISCANGLYMYVFIFNNDCHDVFSL